MHRLNAWRPLERTTLLLAIITIVALVSGGCQAVKNLTNPEKVVARVVSIEADTTTLPEGGGEVVVTASVSLDGNAEAGVPVVFESTAGSWLPDNETETDEAGKASRTLSTTEPATVKAKVRAAGLELVTSNEIEILLSAEGGGAATSGNVEIELTTTPEDPKIGDDVQMEVTATNPDDGSWVTGTLKVQFGDGKQEVVENFNGQGTVTHTYEENSLFNVIVEVTQEDGAATSQTFSLKVGGSEAEAVELTAKTERTPAREPVEFKVRPENDKGRIGAGEVKIDWGDGRSTNLGLIDEVTWVEHIFREPGSYRVLAELQDAQGAQSRSSVRIRVDERLTVAGELAANDTTPVVKTPVELTFTATRSDGANPSGTVRLRFGDGSNTSAELTGSVTVEHTYDHQGAFLVEADFTSDDDRTARASLRIDVVAESSGGGGGGGGGGGSGGGGSGDGGGGGSANDEIDPAAITWLHANPTNWAVTSTVTGTSISDSQICINHTKAGDWPVVSSIEGNPWVVANIDGTWYGGTYEWLRPGQVCKGLGSNPPTTTIADQMGPHIKVEPLRSWKPRSGETVYLMVSTPGRVGIRSIDERSNLVKVIWP